MWSVSRPGRFTPGTHWVEEWVSPRATLGIYTTYILIVYKVNRKEIKLCTRTAIISSSRAVTHMNTTYFRYDSITVPISKQVPLHKGKTIVTKRTKSNT